MPSIATERFVTIRNQESNRRETQRAPKAQRFGNPSMYLAFTIWLAIIGVGMVSVWSYAHEQGEKHDSPLQWPASTQISISENKPALLLFAHPKCPCTRSSLREFERLTTRVGQDVDAVVVFYLPNSANESWRDTDLVRHAKTIPGIQVVFDVAGFECDLFQARTSGLTILFSSSGQMLFQGGVTFSRGHEGSNDGISALTALILGQPTAVHQTPVYGCPLQNPKRTIENRQ